MTDELIASMAARGWDHEPGTRDFSARASVSHGYTVSLRVWQWDPGVWTADYGWSGVSFSAYAKHSDPAAAADEAETWLRGVLGAFRFPWLRVDGREVPSV